MVSLLLLLLYLGCTTNQSSIPFGYLLQLLVQGHPVPSTFSGVFLVCTRDTEGTGDCGSGVCTAEEANGVGYMSSGNITTVGVQTHLKAFYMYEDCRLNQLYCKQIMK
jgi:hypothetical protein